MYIKQLIKQQVKHNFMTSSDLKTNGIRYNLKGKFDSSDEEK